MFEKLRKAFSSAAKNIGQKEISEKDLDNILFDLQLSLLESDVAQEVAEDLSVRLKPKLLGLRVEKEGSVEELVKSKLQGSVAEMFARAGKLNLVQAIKAKKEAKKGPFVIVFLGINGTGKTTTVAKVAHLLKKSGLSVVLAAGDTHRTGAIEQLSTHAQRLSIKVIAQRYGADPSAVGRDALDYARKHYIDAVLVDTAGRMQTSKNLMDEMSKIVRVVKPDLKIFVGDSLAGNDTVNQAREFFQYASFDGAILTKVDADAKGGAAISLVHITARPITLIGVGQGYDDIITFDPDKFIESIFGSTPAISVESLMSESRLVEPEVPEVPQQQQIASGLGTPAAVEKQVEEKEPQIAAPVVTAPAEKKKATPTILGNINAIQTETDIPQTKEQERQFIHSSPVLPKEKPDEKKIITEPQQLEQKRELSPTHQVLEEEQQPKEKKRGMFGGLFGGRGREEKEKEKDKRSKQEEEEKKRKQKMEEEEKEREWKRQKELEKEKKREEEKRRKEEKERQKRERERAEQKEEEEQFEDQEEQAGNAVKQKEEGEGEAEKEEGKDQEDKIIYLTDEDIEDLLK